MIVFFTIDGVLNDIGMLREHGYLPPDEGMFDVYVVRFKKILDDLKAKPVLTSPWRLDADMLDIVRQRLAVYGIEVLDVTGPCLGSKADEIVAWLGAHPEHKKYVILDDQQAACPPRGTDYFYLVRDGLEAKMTEDIISDNK